MSRSDIDTTRNITFGAEAGRRKPKVSPRRKPKGSPPSVFTAEWDYAAAESDELSMKAGDKIELIKTVDMDWSQGKNTRTGETGLFPNSYVKKN